MGSVSLIIINSEKRIDILQYFTGITFQIMYFMGGEIVLRILKICNG